jgi:hypothetical protein
VCKLTAFLDAREFIEIKPAVILSLNTVKLTELTMIGVLEILIAI